MPFVKGQPKTPGSGIKKGQRIKRSTEILDVFEEFDYCPAREALKLIMDMKNELEIDERMQAHIKLLKYKFPELKSIEHKGELDLNQRVESLDDYIRRKQGMNNEGIDAAGPNDNHGDGPDGEDGPNP